MKTAVDEQPHTKMVSSVRWKVALAFSAFILIGANDGALGVILPSLRNYYHVNTATVGLLFLASTFGYAVSSFNNGFLIEKLGKQLFLMMGAAIILLGAVIFSLQPPYVLTFVAALLLGFGVAMLDAGLNSYIAGLPRNTALLNYLHAFYGAGAWLGPVIAASLLALHWGWNSVYWVWGGMSLLLILGFRLIFKTPALMQTDDKKAEGSEGYGLGTLLRLRVVWLAAFFLLFYVGTEVSLGSWSYSFLTEERHGVALISGWIVSGYWLGLTLGRLALGHVGERLGNKRLIQASLGGVVLGILLVWFAPTQAVAAVGLWITGFFLGPIFPTTIALMAKLVSPRALPGAIGFVVSLGSAGAALFPWLAGNLAQRIGLWSLLPYVIVLTVVMLGLWLALQRSKIEISFQEPE